MAHKKLSTNVYEINNFRMPKINLPWVDWSLINHLSLIDQSLIDH